jgi:hypothetical protein
MGVLIAKQNRGDEIGLFGSMVKNLVFTITAPAGDFPVGLYVKTVSNETMHLDEILPQLIIFLVSFRMERPNLQTILPQWILNYTMWLS